MLLQKVAFGISSFPIFFSFFFFIKSTDDMSPRLDVYAMRNDIITHVDANQVTEPIVKRFNTCSNQTLHTSPLDRATRLMDCVG